MKLAPAGPRIAPGRHVWVAAAFAAIVGVAVIAGTQSSLSIGTTAGVLGALGLGLGAYMFLSERVEGPLLLLMLYLGLLDGFLKLRSGSDTVTLGRDALLYALVLGVLARALLRKERLRLPPLSGWVLAFAAVVLVQLANPRNTTLVHSLGALRPHLEFIPLFFVGYWLLQTPKRLKVFLVLLLVIATANGLVSLVQLNLTPDQLSQWGPGYSARINGTGTGVDKVSGRGFTTDSGEVRTRPFGLASDSGGGAAWGMIAVGAALALLATSGRLRGWNRLLLIFCAGPPLAVITGQGRTLLLAAIVVLLAYVGLATTAERLIPTLVGTVVGLVVIVGVIAYVASISGSGVFDRYSTVTPDKLASSTDSNRGQSIDKFPKLVTTRPLGNGLGSVGPAAGFAGGGPAGGDGETQPTFLVTELGIPGLLVMLGLHLTLLWLGFTRIRRLPGDTRIYVAALVAALVGLSVSWVSGATTANSPFSAFLWLTTGALSYWLVTVAGSRPERVGSREAPSPTAALVAS